MGEMADYALEQVFTYEEAKSDYRSGQMSMEDAIMHGVVDEQGYEYSPEFQSGGKKITTRTCRCCKQEGLYWKQVGSKWMLHDRGSVHECKVNKFKKMASKT